mgnify:CR=1 FL=1
MVPPRGTRSASKSTKVTKSLTPANNSEVATKGTKRKSDDSDDEILATVKAKRNKAVLATPNVQVPVTPKVAPAPKVAPPKVAPAPAAASPAVPPPAAASPVLHRVVDGKDVYEKPVESLGPLLTVEEAYQILKRYNADDRKAFISGAAKGCTRPNHGNINRMALPQESDEVAKDYRNCLYDTITDYPVDTNNHYSFPRCDDLEGFPMILDPFVSKQRIGTGSFLLTKVPRDARAARKQKAAAKLLNPRYERGTRRTSWSWKRWFSFSSGRTPS